MDDKLKHLDYIQAAIARMASNSFLVKRWCIVVVASVVYLALKSDSIFLAMSALTLPISLFASFDLYFLRLERLFRALYNDVRIRKCTDFSMDVCPFRKQETLRIAARRPVFWAFYGGLAIVWACGLGVALLGGYDCKLTT